MSSQDHRAPFDCESTSCERQAISDLLSDAKRLRAWLEDAEAIGCRADAIIDTVWSEIINAEGSRHVAAKAVFLRHYLLDLIWGLEREAKAIEELYSRR